MDLAHLHLILNHVPIVGFPFLLVLGIWAHLRHDNALRKFLYAMAIGLTLITAGAFQTGEPAEDRAESAGVAKSLIHDHEEAAETAMVFAWVTAALAVVALISIGKPSIDKVTAGLFALSLVLTIVALGWTGYVGGQIRHGDGVVATSSPSVQETDDDD
jgi:hypothetical protein